ncbi:MAG: hypothetical protein ACRC9Q_09410 [Bacteroidales bacterium]
MKKFLLFPFVIMNALVLFGQTNSTGKEFILPLGCRVVLQVDSILRDGSCKYSVIYYEEFSQIIDTYDNEALFFKDVPDNAIQIVFSISTHGKTRTDVQKNYRSALFIKSNLPENIKYKADIQNGHSDEYINTSVYPVFKQIKSTELWPGLIKSITLYDFKILQPSEINSALTLRPTLNKK